MTFLEATKRDRLASPEGTGKARNAMGAFTRHSDRRDLVRMTPFFRPWWRLLAALLLVAPSPGHLPASGAAAPSQNRLRLLIETDAGGDPDDEQSMVRFLLYANEWDIEGIIANRPVARPGENRNRERTGLGIVTALVDAYGRCWTNLVQHDPQYPPPATLRQRAVAGYDDRNDAVDLILRAVDSPDPRPLWYSDWGSDHGSATNNLRRALDRVLRERGPAGYATFKDRLRLASYDKFAEHTRLDPPWKLWVNTWQPELGGRRWYHRFSALTARAGGFDLTRDVLTGHGPLGALYPVNTGPAQKEGDSCSFLYLVPTGMNDPLQPEWGSWGGRYGLREDAAGRPCYWANRADSWLGTTNRDNTLLRWAEALQNDFRARLDWCVQPFAAANHPPHVVLNGDEGTEVVRLTAKAGGTVHLDSQGTSDPDGQDLRFRWSCYPEAGTYRGLVGLEDAAAPVVRLRIPEDAAGQTLHLLLEVTDAGAPPLTRYRRAVVGVAAR